MDLCENVVKAFEMHNSLKANKHISRCPVRDATCTKQMTSLHKFILILDCSSTSDSFNIPWLYGVRNVETAKHLSLTCSVVAYQHVFKARQCNTLLRV